jgi:hypothetical protein
MTILQVIDAMGDSGDCQREHQSCKRHAKSSPVSDGDPDPGLRSSDGVYLLLAAPSRALFSLMNFLHQNGRIG